MVQVNNGAIALKLVPISDLSEGEDLFWAWTHLKKTKLTIWVEKQKQILISKTFMVTFWRERTKLCPNEMSLNELNLVTLASVTRIVNDCWGGNRVSCVYTWKFFWYFNP